MPETSRQLARRTDFVRPTQFKIDTYVMDTLLPDLVLHDHRPSTFIVYLYLWYRASGQRTAPRASHQEMATATGLSKSAVQGAVRILIRRRLVHATREGITAVPQYTVLRPWRRPPRADRASSFR